MCNCQFKLLNWKWYKFLNSEYCPNWLPEYWYVDARVLYVCMYIFVFVCLFIYLLCCNMIAYWPVSLLYSQYGSGASLNVIAFSFFFCPFPSSCLEKKQISLLDLRNHLLYILCWANNLVRFILLLRDSLNVKCLWILSSSYF